jgi:hypothetical protein
MGNLFQELKRLKVFKVRATYAIVGWVLALIAAFVVDAFAAPQWVHRRLFHQF